MSPPPSDSKFPPPPLHPIRSYYPPPPYEQLTAQYDALREQYHNNVLAAQEVEAANRKLITPLRVENSQLLLRSQIAERHVKDAYKALAAMEGELERERGRVDKFRAELEEVKAEFQEVNTELGKVRAELEEKSRKLEKGVLRERKRDREGERLIGAVVGMVRERLRVVEEEQEEIRGSHSVS